MDFIGVSISIYKRKEEKHEFWELGCLIMSFESLMDIIKKVPGLGSLIAFIGINNLFGVKNYI